MRMIVGKIVRILQAKHYKRHLKEHLNVYFGQHAGANQNSIFEGENYVGDRNYIQNCYLGKYSYLGRDVDIKNAFIGRYTSIAAEVELLSGKHPSRKYVSTHPAFYSTSSVSGKSYVSKQKYIEMDYIDNTSYQWKIGNDVWIGYGATIMEGIKVADGAIIGAKALVTKDVPSYSIVGGVPAKVIGYRFSEEDIQWLIKLQWWNRSEAWIKEYAEFFENISLLRNKVGELDT